MTKMTTYKIYWTEIHPMGDISRSIDKTTLSEALKFSEALRKMRKEGLKISHITMVSENSDQVGQQGVDTIVDGKTPDGETYDWKKERAGRFKTADMTKNHLKADEQ